MSGKTREQQLDELLDKQAIYELIMAYCNAADRHDHVKMRWYVALQYALLVPLVVHFLGIVKDIPTADALVYAGVIAFTAVALGALLEGLPWGRWLEMLRLLAVGAVFALLPDWFGFQAPVALRAAVLVFAVASVVWLLRRRTALGQVAA